MRFLRSRFFVACVASTVTALVVGGVAWAVQSPIDGTGTIHACYSQSTGVVKLQTGATCPATGSNTPITWNGQGQPGPQGVQGPAGPQGSQGAAAPAAQVRNIELGPATVPENTWFRYPEIDVHDCAHLTVTIKRSTNPAIATVEVEPSQGGISLGVLAVVSSAASTGSSGLPVGGFWDVQDHWTPYPTVTIALFGSGVGAGVAHVDDAWVGCQTFG